MRRHEHMVLNLGMVSNMIPTPKNHVISKFDKRLDGVVLEDEAVLAELDVPPDERIAAHVARELETALPCLLGFRGQRPLPPFRAGCFVFSFSSSFLPQA